MGYTSMAMAMGTGSDVNRHDGEHVGGLVIV
jgi:hypothetical protein